MKNLILFLFLLISSISFAQDVWVNGYTRKDGTYVQGYYRTRPDNTVNNNYSTQGNTNPYTSKEGTVPRQSYNSTYNSTYTTPVYTTPSYSSPEYRMPTPTKKDGTPDMRYKQNKQLYGRQYITN